MELSNERKDSLGAQENILGGGKDLLYGWLVGRAAADLGLAQALVASEAQRSEQLKRLEDHLLAQIRELEKRQASNLSSEGNAADLAALKAELQSFSVRQEKLETEHVGFEQLEAVISAKLREFEGEVQQESQHRLGGDLSDFKLELKLLADRVARAEFSNQQLQVQAANESHIEELVNRLIHIENESLKAKIFEELSQQQPWSTPQGTHAEWVKTLDEMRGEINQVRANSELSTLRNELDKLSQRLGQLELTSNPATALTDELNLWSKEINERLSARIETLVSEIDNQILAITALKADRESDTAELLAIVERMGRLEQTAVIDATELKAEINTIKYRLSDPAHIVQATEVAVKMFEEAIGSRVSELNGELIHLAERVTQLTNHADDATLREAERQELTRKIEANVAERIQELESRLAEKLGQRESSDWAEFKIEMSGLANRMAQMELASQQAQLFGDDLSAYSQPAIEALRAELTATKVEMEQRHAESAQRLIQRLEETFNARLHQLDNVLARERQDEQRHDKVVSEIRSEMQVLAQRLAQTESSAQHTHALMVNETAQTAQSRENALNELTALQTRLAEHESRDGHFESLSNELNERVFEIQDQLRENLVLIGSREGEIAQLRLEVQKLAQMGAPKPSAQSETVHRLPEPMGATARLRAEAPQPLKAGSAGNEPNSLLQSYDAETVGSIDQKKQLQQRMSADIERVRAELRKRAGVSR